MTDDFRYSSRVHALFWAAVPSGAVGVVLVLAGLLTQSFPLGMIGAFVLAVASILAVRWMEVAESENPDP